MRFKTPMNMGVVFADLHKAGVPMTVWILYVTLVAGGCPWVAGIYRDYSLCFKEKKRQVEQSLAIAADCKDVWFAQERGV